MELCAGGELFSKIISIGQFTEYDAAFLFKLMMNAVYYLTEKGICHRDLKPENFLFSTTEKNSNLKLIDFGLSQIFAVPGKITKKQFNIGIGKVKMTASVGTV
jgi:calcium-dependent protein kinase